ncbi:hypothetical protein DSO57_1037035 [Entomophthora muscae]|uniref:Uncharacterized protein n=1 Tax=Entomophthora muscae TaxID=34485 RepID=A0ACC2RDS0_9FUNG|nr:hypothetical protein DSO57_1037035 [Entomophthora muscae]
MDNNNQLKSPLDVPQFQLSNSTPNMQAQDINAQLPAGASSFQPPNSDYLQPQQMVNLLSTSSPQVLKERIEELKRLTNKLQFMKDSVVQAFSPLLNSEASITSVPPEFGILVQRAQSQINEFKMACHTSTAFIQEAETHLNPNGTMFVGIKRKTALQDEYPQRDNSFGREALLKKKPHTTQSVTSDLPRERLKAKCLQINSLRNNPPIEKLIGLKEITDDWNAIFFKETVPAGCFISDSDLSNQYQTIQVKILNEFTAILLVQDIKEENIRRIHKVNFFSTTEQDKTFEDSEHHVYKALTNASIEQLPFPSNVPDTYPISNGDPLLHILDWIYSFKEMFSTPCAKCNKVMMFTPTSPAKFLPPIIRRYDPFASCFVPLHTNCAQSI